MRPYVRRMIPETGDVDREVPYSATEIWLRVQQMMKGSDIGIQDKKAKLFNEWKVQNVGNQVVQDAVQNQGVQNVGNQNGQIVVPGITNQNPNGNGNVVAARAEVRTKRRDDDYLQTQLLIAQKEEAGIQLQAEEFDLMAAAADLDEIEEVNAKCILMANLPASTSEEQYTELLEPIPEPHQVQQNDSNVISEISSVEQEGGTVDQHPATVEETRAYFESLYNNLALEVEKHSKLNANSELKCVKCNGCMLSDNHDLCVLDFINNVNARKKSESVNKSSKRKVWKPTGNVFSNIGFIWKPIGRTFTIVGNACPLTRITTTTMVPLRKPTALENETPKPDVTLVYSRKPRKSKTNVPVSKFKVIQIILWYLDSDFSKHMTGDHSQLTNFVNKSLGTVKFRNDHVAKILGYGDYQIGNIMISRVYYVKGLGHNLFSVGQLCYSNLEVVFHQHTCFIRNLEGVDLLTGSPSKNLYTLSLRDMMASSPICLLSKASKTKSWLWHRRLSHLNFGAINHLARHGLVRSLPKLKFEKDQLCSACAMGKSKKKPHKPKSEDTNQEKLYILHMDLCGLTRVASCYPKIISYPNTR
ncbi:integrase, catalytic region, zinc finger, CCHC-type containing protein [Tanacetum coccineum]